MTQPQPVPAASGEAVASTLVATLERAWQSIVGHHPEVPEVVVVVAPGSGGRDLKLGHFAAGRWEVEGNERCELLVGAEGLRYGSLDVLGTLLHEAAHGLGWTRGVVDTSRGGRYHNRRYKLLAEEVGLAVAQVGSIGWSDTTVVDATARRYRATLAGHRRRPGPVAAGGGQGGPGGGQRAQPGDMRVPVRAAGPHGPGHHRGGPGHVRAVRGCLRPPGGHRARRQRRRHLARRWGLGAYAPTTSPSSHPAAGRVGGQGPPIR